MSKEQAQRLLEALKTRNRIHKIKWKLRRPSLNLKKGKRIGKLKMKLRL